MPQKKKKKKKKKKKVCGSSVKLKNECNMKNSHMDHRSPSARIFFLLAYLKNKTKAALQSFWHVLPGKHSAGVTDDIKNDCIPFK